ncbi:Oidioi.mRNA.OKI2018_I69.chr2.g4032.t1.cds [Oikopleura dioica]|uniref:Probable arginine--tRNA ligase, mitochondrial n=1 Tax=Oikopleura dioica TaxID=34765 RepID=A0ABN7T1J4_OIKDI|nr:Oidioi.mRNA.OKI2018_I69.chr2.g4032.t1.cds [Oikopleura dioica]
MSEENYRKQYNLFDVNFDHWERESDVASPEDIYRLLRKVGHSCSSSEMNKDVILRLKKWNPSWAMAGNKKSRKKNMKQTHHEVKLLSAGRTIYLSRDVLTAIKRSELYSADVLCYITDMSQKEHFHKLCSTLDYFGYPDVAEKIDFVGFGKLEGMSTRAGTGLSLESVVQEALELQAETMEKQKSTYLKHNFEQLDDLTKKKHAAWFVAASVFSSKRQKDLKFNWQLHLKNDNGMYLQRTYSKIKNLLSKNNARTRQMVITDDADFSAFALEPHWRELLEFSASYSNAREKSISELDGFILLQFGLRLGQLAHKVMSKDEKWIELDQNSKELYERIILFECILQIFEDLLNILGYKPTDQF